MSDKYSMTPEEILTALDKKQEVCRWNCYRNRNTLRSLVLTPKYKHLELAVEAQVELAKDSL